MDLTGYKVILDTDLGDDIDDAFALALLLKSNVDIEAITTVFKNTKARAKQAKELLNTINRKDNVYYGDGMPVDGNIIPFQNETGNLLESLPPQYSPSMDKYEVEGSAVDRIIEAAHKYPNKLIIVAIGPLTNIAKAIKKDPSIVNKIYRLYEMGGNFSEKSQEWNIMCDAKAADIVYSSGLDIYAVGCDITMKCPLDGKLFDDFKESNNPLLKQIFIYFDRWINYFHFEKSILHDPLALSCMLEDGICEFEERYVKVDYSDLRGSISTTTSKLDGYSKINVAVSVNKEKFVKLLYKYLY